MSCETCKYANEDGNGTHCRGCIHNAEDHYKPITNADRIRNMTDEILAEFLVDTQNNAIKRGKVDSVEEALETLQAEVEEE